MTKPKPKLKTKTKLRGAEGRMWGLYNQWGGVQFSATGVPLLFQRKSNASASAMHDERVARVIVTIRPVAGRGKK